LQGGFKLPLALAHITKVVEDDRTQFEQAQLVCLFRCRRWFHLGINVDKGSCLPEQLVGAVKISLIKEHPSLRAAYVHDLVTLCH
jgi:hypothetical protein